MIDKIIKSPPIRFAGFTDTWEQRELGKNAIIKGRLGWKSLKQEEYINEGPSMIAGKHISNGIIDWSKVDHIPQWRYDESPEIMLENGDVIFSKDGSLGNPALIENLELEATINSTMMLVRTNETINSKFFYQVLTSDIFQRLIYLKVSGSSIPHLFQADMNEFKFMAPTVEEQSKIGSFLEVLDNLITLHQRKLELLKETKKGMLQKFFPKDGESIPEIRFAGFTDAWEQCKFSEILKSHSFRAYLAEPNETGNYKVIQQGDNPLVGYSDGEPFEDYEGITLFGDHTVSLYKPTEPFFVATDGVKILSGHGFDGMYLFSTLERYKPESQGYKRHFTILKNEGVWFTKNNDEQVAIGLFFTNLDNLITLHQRELDLLKDLKKSMLQQMFI